jgi:hypothetical protein
VSEVERVLAAHSVDLSGLRRDRETVVGYWMACTCGFEWSPVRNGPDRHQPHVAEQIEALIAERERAAQAEVGQLCAALNVALAYAEGRVSDPTHRDSELAGCHVVLDKYATTDRIVPSGDDGPCQVCGQPYPPWRADHTLWNLVMGGPDATDDPGGMLCPNHFLRLADDRAPMRGAWVVGTPVRPERAVRAEALRDFVQWVASNRAHNGSDYPHGQSLYNECINAVLPHWAADWLLDQDDRIAQDAPENAPTEQMRYDDGSWSRTIAPTAPRPDESGGA